MRSADRNECEARCERLLGRSELLNTRDLPWESVGDVAVSREVRTTLVYMRDVEAFTNRYLTGLVAHPATLGDRLIARFLPIWQAEEAAHARALDRYLRLYEARRGRHVPDIQEAPSAGRGDRWLVLLTRPVGPVVTAAHMTWGAANELLTMTGYRLLARRCGDPVLADLLKRIAAQESRHYSFYRLQAERRLADSRLARRVLPVVMKRSWTPVGVGDGFKSAEEFDRVLGFLAADERGARAIETMDGAFRRLPGMGDVSIYRRAVEASRRRCEVPRQQEECGVLTLHPAGPVDIASALPLARVS